MTGTDPKAYYLEGALAVGTPTVTAISPPNAPTAGDVSLTILGTGFGDASGVRFGGTPAPSFAVVSDSEIQATAPTMAPGTVDVEVIAGDGTPASPSAVQLAVRELAWSDEFTGTEIDPAKWGVYDGPGNEDNGIRSPAQISVQDSAVTITCDREGTTGGLWGNWTQQCGVWEARVKATAASDSIHPILVLWPHDDVWPQHGEVDYCECESADRQSVAGYLHYGDDGDQSTANVRVDLTQWQVFTVVWTPSSMAYYCNGRRWFHDADPSHMPPVGMNPTIQLDWTGDPIKHGGAMSVDWVRIYSNERLELPPQLMGVKAPDTAFARLRKGLSRLRGE